MQQLATSMMDDEEEVEQIDIIYWKYLNKLSIINVC